MRENFSEIKQRFSREGGRFIELDSNIGAKNRIVQNILHQPFAMILIYGPPGVGKTYLLQQIYASLHDKMDIHFQKLPFEDPVEFFNNLFMEYLGKESTQKSVETMLKEFEREYAKESLIILLDEVQMYKEQHLEYVRLLSDSRKFKFVITVHKVEKEDAIAKEYFQSRIWETIELKNLSKEECGLYLGRKLDNTLPFSQKNVAKIHRLTNGNLRKIDRIVMIVLDILEHYRISKPSKLQSSNIINRALEMAAIETGLIKG